MKYGKTAGRQERRKKGKEDGRKGDKGGGRRKEGDKKRASIYTGTIF